MMDAGLLIVIEVLTPPTSIPLKRIRMSSRDDTATPHVPNSPFASGSSVSYPYGRHIKGDAEAGLAVGDEILESAVRVLRAPEPGEHPHRPQPAEVHGGMDPAGEWETARVAEPLVRLPGDVERRVQPHHGPTGRLEDIHTAVWER